MSAAIAGPASAISAADPNRNFRMTRPPRVMTKGAVCRERTHSAVAYWPHRDGFANGARFGRRCVDALASPISPARKHYLLPSTILLGRVGGQLPWSRGPDGNASRAWAGYLRRHHRGAGWPAP